MDTKYLRVTGTMDVDKKSLDVLTEEIRKDVIEGIANNGFDIEDLYILLKTLSPQEYIDLLEETITEPMIHDENNVFSKNAERKLEAIEAILKIK